MASKLYNVLNGINNGIEKCKENAKLAGFPVNEHTTLYALADMFKQINNVENMRVRYTRSWKRPEHWLDAETILRNAPEINGMQPRFIVLINEAATSTTLDKYVTTTNLSSSTKFIGVEGVQTSDGVWYDLTSASATHTWDTSIIEQKYIIGYSSSPVIRRFYSSLSSVDEIIFGNCQINQLYIDTVTSIRCLPDLIDSTMNVCGLGYISNGFTLRNIDLSGVKKLVFYSHSSYTPSNNIKVLPNAYYLVNFKAPDVEEIEINPGYNTTHTLFAVPYLYLPKLKSINYTGTSSSYYSTVFGAPDDTSQYVKSGLFLDAPELETVSRVSLVLAGSYLPKLTSVTGANSKLTIRGNGANHYLPLLKEVGTGRSSCYLYIDQSFNLYLPSLEVCDYIAPNYSGNGYFLTGSISMPKLHTVRGITMFSSNYTQIRSNLNAGIYIDVPSLKTINALGSSAVEISLDVINMPSIETIAEGLNKVVDKYLKFPETLKNIPGNFLLNTTALKYLDLPDNFALSGLNLAKPTLTKRCLLDIVSKLADVSSDSNNTYEITFGETNIAKLTTEEWQVAIDKGWVITDLVEEASE